MFFALRPHHENVIDKLPPDKGFVSGVFDGLLFKFAHEQICVGLGAMRVPIAVP